MNSTSASLYGSRPSPAGVACRPADGRLAQPLPAAAASTHQTIAERTCISRRNSSTVGSDLRQFPEPSDEAHRREQVLRLVPGPDAPAGIARIAVPGPSEAPDLLEIE